MMYVCIYSRHLIELPFLSATKKVKKGYAIIADCTFEQAIEHCSYEEEFGISVNIPYAILAFQKKDHVLLPDQLESVHAMPIGCFHGVGPVLALNVGYYTGHSLWLPRYSRTPNRDPDIGDLASVPFDVLTYFSPKGSALYYQVHGYPEQLQLNFLDKLTCG